MNRETTVERLIGATGLLRLHDIIGQAAVSEEEAQRNRAAGRGPRRARPGRPAIVPVSAASLWRWISAGKFPSPLRLGERGAAWRAADVARWLESRAPGATGDPITRKPAAKPTPAWHAGNR